MSYAQERIKQLQEQKQRLEQQMATLDGEILGLQKQDEALTGKYFKMKVEDKEVEYLYVTGESVEQSQPGYTIYDVMTFFGEHFPDKETSTFIFQQMPDFVIKRNYYEINKGELMVAFSGHYQPLAVFYRRMTNPGTDQEYAKKINAVDTTHRHAGKAFSQQPYGIEKERVTLPFPGPTEEEQMQEFFDTMSEDEIVRFINTIDGVSCQSDITKRRWLRLHPETFIDMLLRVLDVGEGGLKKEVIETARQLMKAPEYHFSHVYGELHKQLRKGF